MLRLPPLQFILALCTCVVCSDRSYPLTVGPKAGETGRYVYKVSGTDYTHCVYCPQVAFQDTANNIKYQEVKCIANYPETIKDGLSNREKNEKKYPLCKVGGEVPVCGSPPEVELRNGEHWYCDPGYSNTNYSVYFSCAVICGTSRDIARSFYCNESLEWEEETGKNFQTCYGTVTNKLVNLDNEVLLICVIVLASVVVLAVIAVVVGVCLKVRRPKGIEIRSSTNPEVKVLIEGPTQSGNKGSEGSAKECSASEHDSLTGSSKADSDDRSDSTNVTIETDTNTDSDGELSECIDSKLNRATYFESEINYGQNKHEEFIECVVDTESDGDDSESYRNKTESYGDDTKNYGEHDHQKTMKCFSSKTYGRDRREDVTAERQNGRNREFVSNYVEDTTDDALLSGSRLAPLGEESPEQLSTISHHTSCQTSCYSSSQGVPSHAVSIPQVNTESVNVIQDTPSFSSHRNGNHRHSPSDGISYQHRSIQSTFTVPQQRPDPTGHSAFSINESGYFDDENDDKHNTEPKHVINTGTGVRGSQTFLPLRHEPEMFGRNTWRDEISRGQLQLMSPGDGSRELITNNSSESFEIQSFRDGISRGQLQLMSPGDGSRELIANYASDSFEIESNELFERYMKT